MIMKHKRKNKKINSSIKDPHKDLIKEIVEEEVEITCPMTGKKYKKVVKITRYKNPTQPLRQIIPSTESDFNLE